MTDTVPLYVLPQGLQRFLTLQVFDLRTDRSVQAQPLLHAPIVGKKTNGEHRSVGENVNALITQWRRSDVLLSSLLGVDGVYAVICDRDGRCQYISPNCEALLGTSAQAVVGGTCWPFLMTSDDAAVAARILRQIVPGGPALECMAHAVNAAGEERTIHWSFKHFNDPGKPESVLAWGFDMTDLVSKAELAVASHQMLDMSPAFSPPRFAQQDARLMYIWVAGAHDRSTNEMIVGKTDADLYAPADAAYLTRLKRRVLATGLGVSTVARTIDRGQHLYYEVSIEPIVGEDGRINGLMCANQDITAQRQTEMERERLLETMRQQQVQMRQLNLNMAMLQAATQKDLSRNLHDILGSGLTTLNLNLTMILEQLGHIDVDVGALRYFLADSLNRVTDLAVGLDEVMEAMRPPYLESDGLSAALQWYVQTLASRISVEIQVSADAAFPRLAPVTEYELFLLVQEALTNVLKHAQAKHVTIRLIASEERLRIAVEDDGIGISNEILEGNPAGRRWGLVTMVGASTVGGRCQIFSTPSEGTRVVVDIN